MKGGAAPNDIHGVDAVSGGTKTSQGLQNMLFDCLTNYAPFFERLKAQEAASNQTMSNQENVQDNE
ncbi:MAG: hypothetical protein L6V35_08405 [Alistipes putredinis]|nr:MAG: hypothetical protein L6V35_08405 [Alistipes putredinis]